MIILLGSNDANDPTSPSGQHVPLDEYKSNLQYMIDYLDSIGISKSRLILLSPPNYHNEVFVRICIENGRTSLPVLSDSVIKLYSESCIQVARDNNVSFIDLHTIFSSVPNNQELFCDGLHLSSKGAKLLYDNIHLLVDAKLESFANTSIDKLFQYPIWSAIDVNNPIDSLT